LESRRALLRSPGDALRGCVFPLHLYSGVAGSVKKRARISAHPECGHEVFEHSSPPGKQDRASERRQMSAGQQEPGFLWNLVLGYGYECSGAGFGSEQVIARSMDFALLSLHAD